MCQRLRQLDAVVRRLAHRAPRELVEIAADEVAQRVAAERVAAEQHDVDREHERADADAELLSRPSRRRTSSAFHDVVREDEEEEQRDVQEVAVDVLEDERKRSLAAVALARLADGAVRRIGPERLVVRAAIVVAGEAEAGRGRAGSAAPARTAASTATTPACGPNHACGESPNSSRRVERREVWPVRVVRVLERRPRRVDDESAEDDEDDERLEPPRVAAHRLAEPATRELNDCLSHRARSPRRKWR